MKFAPACMALFVILPMDLCALPSASRCARPLTVAERTELVAAANPKLAEQRAGAPAPVPSLGAEAREALLRAQAASPELRDLRGGEFTDREWMIIAITALVVLALVIVF